MTIRVLYFGGLRQRLGATEEEVQLPEPPTVASLKSVLEARHAFLATHWGSVRLAVNMEFADDTLAVQDGDEVALIPPVAGGAPAARVVLTSDPLSVDAAFRQVRSAGLGGLCAFVGCVRDHAHGRRVREIDYSAYGPMALKVMERIVSEAEAQHGATVTCHHRVGRLQVGDDAVVIVAAAAHRAEAFAACRQVIEQLKQDVPIWKEEFGEDGATWVGMGP